mmetsp:Transcript_12658/g.21509  ORF Transcript_12658/g.21509 Transcript_12658/m.21509 type:complete len:234 (+) Transcript_12658:88-789(+)
MVSVFQLVLCLCVKITGLMTFVQLLAFIAPHLVDLASSNHSRTFTDFLRPSDDIAVLIRIKKFSRTAIHRPQHQSSIPRKDGHICNGVLIAHHVFIVGQMLIQYIQLTFRFHSKAVDGVFQLDGGVAVKMAKTTTEIGSCTNLPEQPIQHLHTLGWISRDEGFKLFCQMKENRTGLKQFDGFLLTGRTIDEGWNLGIGIDLHKSTTELITLADMDRPGIVLGIGMACFQKFFE